MENLLIFISGATIGMTALLVFRELGTSPLPPEYSNRHRNEASRLRREAEAVNPERRDPLRLYVQKCRELEKITRKRVRLEAENLHSRMAEVYRHQESELAKAASLLKQQIQNPWQGIDLIAPQKAQRDSLVRFQESLRYAIRAWVLTLKIRLNKQKKTRPAPQSSHKKKPPSKARRTREHEILGLEPDANTQEINLAFRQKLKENHPDRVARPETTGWYRAQKRTIEIVESRNQLLKSK